jgi:cyclopropane fatty-acyl-phospholipid synthase-like methyltransferase
MNTENYSEKYYQSNQQQEDRPALGMYTRILRRYIRSGQIIDFGCGTGNFIKRLSKYYTVHGFDVSEYAKTQTIERNPKSVVYTNILDIPDNCFDAIVSLHVLEHIEDQKLKDVLNKWYSALKIDGIVLCVIPDIDGEAHSIKGNEWIGFSDPTHINLKKRDSWKKLFDHHHFEIIKISSDGLWDNPYSKFPKIIDLLLYSKMTVLQFLLGRLIIPEGNGESSIFILRKKESKK